MRQCYYFYRSLVGCVEIKKDEKLHKIYFRKPSVSRYLTHQIKYDLI